MGRSPADDVGLLAALEDGQTKGMLGPGSVAEQVAHSRAFEALLAPGARVADLGSGGGLPALVIAHDRPDLQLTLIEASERRADHLWRMVQRLALADRVMVDGRAAEVVAQDPVHRGAYDVVTARGFAGPAVTAECGVGLLRVGGALLVAEPPEDRARWDPLGGSPLPLVLHRRWGDAGAHLAELHLLGPCPARFPRPAGVPSKRPLF